jgi:hypothetical protein
MDPLRSYYENSGEINTMTSRRQPTFEEKVRLIKEIGAMLKFGAEHLRSRTIAPPPAEGKWFDKLRVSGKEEERLYAEPKYNWQLGEIDPPGGKLAKEYIMNPAIKIGKKVIQGDYAKGGHIEIVNKIDRDPKLKAAFDRGEYIEGATTDAGTFVGKRPDVDFADIKGRDVSEIEDLLEWQ